MKSDIFHSSPSIPVLADLKSACIEHKHLQC